MSLTNEQRTAIKSAIARHPGYKAKVLPVHGKYASEYTVDELRYACQVLQINAREIISCLNGDKKDQFNLEEDARVEREIADASLKEVKNVSDAKSLMGEVLAGFAQQDFKPLEDVCRRALTPVEKIVEKQVVVEKRIDDSGAEIVEDMPHAKVTGRKTLGQAFGIRGKYSKQEIDVWDAPDAPPVDSGYVFDSDTIGLLAACMETGQNAWLVGPHSAGKSTLARELAARTGRPYVRIGCDGGLEVTDLIGMTVPSKDGGTRFKNGVLTEAIQRPGTVVCIDEPTMARVGVMASIRTILDERYLVLKEHGGATIPIAKGVWFCTADNTSGSGDMTGQYTGTGPIGRPTLDRFPVFVPIDYLPADREAKLLENRTGSPAALCQQVADFAKLTRQEVAKGDGVSGLSIRSEIAWLRLMSAGIDAEQAFKACVIHSAVPEDQEVYTRIAQPTLDFDLLGRLARGESVSAQEQVKPAETEAGRRAQSDFDPIV